MNTTPAASRAARIAATVAGRDVPETLKPSKVRIGRLWTFNHRPCSNLTARAARDWPGAMANSCHFRLHP